MLIDWLKTNWINESFIETHILTHWNVTSAKHRTKLSYGFVYYRKSHWNTVEHVLFAHVLFASCIVRACNVREYGSKPLKYHIKITKLYCSRL